MKRMNHNLTTSTHRRAGLAPLELVLALPLMLFLMALIINIGTVGAWKVRAQANVRNASWRTLHIRTGNSAPNPPMWPATAQLSGAGGSDLTQPQQLWDQEQDLATPSVRGQGVTEPTQGMSIVVHPMLVMQDGVHDGRAPLERQIPLLRGILPSNGRYNLDIRQNVLDGNWEYHNIRTQAGAGYSRNLDQRAAVLYDIEPGDFPSSAALQVQLRQTLAEIRNPGNYTGTGSWADLAPLDADADLARLSMLPPANEPPRPPNPNLGATQPTGNPPDLYPGQRVLQACAADPSVLRTTQHFTRYIENDIRRLPGNVARRFRQYYQDRLDHLQELQNQVPPVPVDTTEMSDLQAEIDLLDEFISALPQQHR